VTFGNGGGRVHAAGGLVYSTAGSVGSGSSGGGGGGSNIAVTALGTAKSQGAVNTLSMSVTVQNNTILRVSYGALNDGTAPAVTFGASNMLQRGAIQLPPLSNTSCVAVYYLVITTGLTATITATLPIGHTAVMGLSAVQISGLPNNSADQVGTNYGPPPTGPTVSSGAIQNVPEAHMATFFLLRNALPILGTWGGTVAFSDIGQDITLSSNLGYRAILSDADNIGTAASVGATLTGDTEDNWAGFVDCYD
jgi:hypothetical protein